jgi:hypothetical protein
MKNKKLLLAIVVVGLAGLVAPQASAQLIITSQTNQFNIFANSAPGSAGYYFSFDILTRDFDKWNGPQSLISVDLTISGRNTGSFFVGASPAVTINSATAQQNFSFVGGGGPASIFDATPYNLATSPGPLPQLSSVGMLNLPDGSNAWQLNGTYGYTDPTLLASYFTGPGTFQMRLNNLLQISASGGTPIGSGLISTGDVIVTLTAVPEPSTWALALAGGVFGWAALRRRR